MMRLRVVILFLMVCLLPACKISKTRWKKRYNHKKIVLQKSFFAGPLPEGPVTIFIHGTKQSLASRMVHKVDYPRGVVPYCLVEARSVMTGVGRTLVECFPEEFPADSFFYYGWSGKMNFPSRLYAAERLYDIVKDHKGPLTLLCHSHGANIALNLAFLACERGDESIKIDRLILLAPPVQEVTKKYIHSPIFKEIYTFYSTADMFQVGDMQGIYWESYAYTPPGTKIPFFSKRTYEPGPNIKQVRILNDWQSPGHLYFMLKQFIRNIPALLDLVKDTTTPSNKFIANIPLFCQPPCLVDPCSIKGNYVPRSSYYRLRRFFCPSKTH